MRKISLVLAVLVVLGMEANSQDESAQGTVTYSVRVISTGSEKDYEEREEDPSPEEPVRVRTETKRVEGREDERGSVEKTIIFE